MPPSLAPPPTGGSSRTAQAVEEHADDAPVVFGSPAGYRLAQLGDGEQQVLGADVVAYRAGGHGGVEQRRERGAQPLLEIAGQSRERRIARVQRGGEPALGAEQFGELVDPRD